jgi:hypothetical protein
MGLQLFTNNAVATLGSAVASTDGAVTLSTGQGALFPSPSGGQFFLVTLFEAGGTGVPNEIVKVTARTGDVFTAVARGQEGTAAANWNVGDNCQEFPTAGTYSSFAQQTDVQYQAGNWADDSGATNAGAVALTPAPPNQAALQGVPVRVLKQGSANTGPYTLNVNGLGAQPVTASGVALVAGQLVASSWFEVMWDGAEYELVGGGAASSPTGPAGGALTGTYPDPQIANGVIVPENFASVSTLTVFSNITGSTAGPLFNTLANFKTALGGPTGAAGGALNGTYPNPGLAITSLPPSGAAGGALNGTYPNPGLAVTALPPNGAAGGVLAGTYPNPTFAAGSVNTAAIAAGAVTAGEMAPAPAETVLSNLTGGSAEPAWNTLANLLTALGVVVPTYAHFIAQHTSGSGSGETLGGNAWTTRGLNATGSNNIAGASLNTGTGVITLPAGTYLATVMACSQATGNVTSYTHKLRLYDDTDSAYLVTGLNNAYAGSSIPAVVMATGQGVFTLAGTKSVSLDSFPSTGCTGGPSTNSGANEVYADVLITKIG